MKVYFSHGKESGPWGTKIRFLADIAESMGCQIESIDYSATMNPEERVALLLEQLPSDDSEVVLVGSSMGGYVSLVAALQYNVKGIFLLAPAVYMPRYEKQAYPVKCAVSCVHGWQDEIIPVENVLKFAREQSASLHLVPGDHRLNDSLDLIAPIFKQFLYSCLTDKV
ncbi:alpha/beta hydrolase [Aestuariibacter sp. GS-14]|uniref:YqiA/YcfP family alpha/beta fold hydrolase n=1 Tax=Alteromonadaceae TaxID=72275 RepID=UPI0011266A38|nr:YqiA/YcfP family alpha/beta fold hydrolase [Aestuariibacter sp. GS-14]TPV59839.1 alpha/beta hydrolase [Aestuariibacter sp. GS-14]